MVRIQKLMLVTVDCADVDDKYDLLKAARDNGAVGCYFQEDDKKLVATIGENDMYKLLDFLENKGFEVPSFYGL